MSDHESLSPEEWAEFRQAQVDRFGAEVAEGRYCDLDHPANRDWIAVKRRECGIEDVPEELVRYYGIDRRKKFREDMAKIVSVLLCYADGGMCWPTNKQLAEGMGCCKEKAKFRLFCLEHDGWISVEASRDHVSNRVIRLNWQVTRNRNLHGLEGYSGNDGRGIY